MGKMMKNKYMRMGVLIGVLAFVVMGAWFVLKGTIFERRANAEAELENIKAQYNDAQNVQTLISDYQGKITELIGGNEENIAKLSKPIDTSDIMHILLKASETAQVSISSIDFAGDSAYIVSKGDIVESVDKKETEEETTDVDIEAISGIKTLEITFNVAGDYANIKAFIGQFEASDYYINVDTCDIKALNGDPALHYYEGKVVLKVYSTTENKE